MMLVSRIFEAIRSPYQCLGHQVTTDASIGIALAPRDGSDIDRILKNADLAMYAAKAAGRRTYRFFETDMEAEVRARRSLEMRSAPGAGRRRLRGLLPALRRPADQRDHRLRGAGALAPSAARHDFARRVHPAGRGHRPDQPARRVGAEHGLQGSRELARQYPARGQRLADSIQERHAGAEGDGGAGRLRPRREPARARDHRGRADPRRRDGARRAAAICAPSASASRSTISAPAIPR